MGISMFGRQILMGIPILVVALPVSGGDSFRGVFREIKTETAIPHDCVKRALEQSTGAEHINYVLANEKPAYTRHFYDYKYEGLPVRLSVLENSSGATISQHYARNRQTPPQSEIDRIRPLMAEVEDNIAKICGPTPHGWKATERCYQVQCGALSSILTGFTSADGF